MNYKSFQNLSDDIKSNIHKLENYHIDLVVGIPRSGMIPAYMISLLLNVNCTDFYSFIENRPLVKGRRSLKNNVSERLLPHDHNNILLVDDSISSGKTMKDKIVTIPSKLKSKIITSAIYSTESKREDVDLFFVYLPPCRVFEWNLFHGHTLSQSCVDIDGVLCLDPTNGENDDGDNYINFIENAKPLFLPTYRIHSLVTNRLEKYRFSTEKWLKNNGITYDHLIMLDLPTKEERQRLKFKAKHKASYYKNSGTCLFIESSYCQAREICSLTGKDVYCMETNYLLTANALAIVKNPICIKKYIPRNIKKFAKSLINFMKVNRSLLGVKVSEMNNSNFLKVIEPNGQDTENGRSITSQRELASLDKIAGLSNNCRSINCTHTTEAGCAILEALEHEVLDHMSYETFLKREGKMKNNKPTAVEK
jgi:uncharacterized HAD superfamily protein/adenine/guanine phosphoribosyltransferase-like PRPP-binding protein